MQQSDELSKVKARILAFSQRTVANGCSEAEAFEAMRRVGELLDTYNLTMSEIEVRQTACTTAYYATGARNRSALDNCVVALASFVDCKVWFARSHGEAKSSQYGFFGHETDIALAFYLLDVLKAAFVFETKAFKSSYAYATAISPREATRSFGLGMAARLANRFREMKEERDRETKLRETEARAAQRAARSAEARSAEALSAEALSAKAQSDDLSETQVSAASQTDLGSIGSLIVLKGQLIEQEFHKSGVKLSKARSKNRRPRDTTGYQRGQEAGGRVNLSRPIGQSTRVSGYL